MANSNFIKKQVCILGATGSVGGGALAVIRAMPERAAAAVLVADRNAEAMAALCLEFRPRRAIMRDEAAAEILRNRLNSEGVEVDGGEEAARRAAEADCDTVVAAIAGGDGLPPVLAAAQCGRRILLANKESLVIAGELLMRTARENGAEILPIDSEHAALFEMLAGGGGYAKLWLTASGGALRDMPLSQLAAATPAQALAHPTWQMGKKITIDSATMMNKALEIIEAAVLFSAPPAKVGAVLHPQSIVHAMLEGEDGALSARMAAPDMRTPIARMMFWPDAVAMPGGRRLDWAALSALSFAEPEAARYPCLQLAAEALALGGAAPATLSAANESAVRRFLDGDIAFTDIARINCSALETHARNARPDNALSLDDLRAAHEDARRRAMEC